jgi:molybdopterin/thiamine biosynthesis adenylyltransferase
MNRAGPVAARGAILSSNLSSPYPAKTTPWREEFVPLASLPFDRRDYENYPASIHFALNTLPWGSMHALNEYFVRNIGSITAEQQQLLQQKQVAVIGCGGLGGYVIETLARIGVGRLHLFDPDTFSTSNCNRQMGALASTMGQNKAEVASERVAAIHPFCQARAFADDFRQVAEKQEFFGDAVVDCLDDIAARRDLAALCDRLGLPLIHGAVNGWCGQVGVQLPGHDLIGHLYPKRPGGNGKSPALSVLSFTVAVVASIQAAETVKTLLGLPSPLHNAWLYIDLKENDFLLRESIL